MKAAQRDSVKEIVSSEGTVRNNVRGLDLPTQSIVRVNFQSAHGAAEVVGLNERLAKAANSKCSFSYCSDELSVSIKGLIIFRPASLEKLFRNFLDFV